MVNEELDNINTLSSNSLINKQFSYGNGNNFLKVFYISDIHLLHHLKEIDNIKGYIKQIVYGLFDEELVKAIKGSDHFIIVFAGDISSKKETNQYFYHQFSKRYKHYLHKYKKDDNVEYYPIYAVLGNHELHDFKSVEDAENYYGQILYEEKIHLLQNSGRVDIGWWGNRYIILGGVGFAKYNDIYNSSNLINTNPPMSREVEIEESDKFKSIYKKALELSHKKQQRLIVLTHYPFEDWLNEAPDNMAVYFSGHTHLNRICQNEKVEIYADNQIGYKNENIHFKICKLGLSYNPFFNYIDGIYEVTTSDYSLFCTYSNDALMGTKVIDNALKEKDSKFYMIKKNNFYGFFLKNKNGLKICYGGRLKGIESKRDIKDIYEKFDYVVKTFVDILLPFRAMQEKIVEEVMSFGFEGKIHGCIIDLDYFCHIIINPFNGEMIYYYSPFMGTMKYEQSFSRLIKHTRITPQKKRLILEKLNENCNYLVLQNKSNLITTTEKSSGYIKVGIKDSLYAVSMRVEQLQRLFKCNILRIWNEDIIKNNI